MEYHPDIGTTGDSEHFRIITEAYKTFMNQKVLSEDQIFYQNIIDDDNFMPEGTVNVSDARVVKSAHGGISIAYGP